MLDKVLTGFTYVWGTLFVAINLIAIASFFYVAPFWEALAKIQDIYSPFNIWNWFAEMALLMPLILAAAWRDHRRKKFIVTRR
jgi:hypothetical protein